MTPLSLRRVIVFALSSASSTGCNGVAVLCQCLASTRGSEYDWACSSR